ncbi:MAG: cation diffusion facilitator family transporter [Leptospirillum sp.]|nr:cation diffusion facilitator family transporter [Nitrospiraceae bacterium]
MQSLHSFFHSVMGFLGLGKSPEDHYGHSHSSSHEHTHGTLDSTITTSEDGIRAVKWSFLILLITAGCQFAIVLKSGSIGLASDLIHNVADATTAFPLWIAFRLARIRPNARFNYGYGRVEDFAGIAIVAIIFLSASVAAFEAVYRFLHPQVLQHLFWVMLAGVAGFIGNEIVAILRIRIGRKINSAALIADGYHARTDGITSLAVVAGAIGVSLGFPLADPIVGLLISIAIFGIVWQSAKAVVTRMLDGSEPAIHEEICHSADHVPGIISIGEIRSRWLGHRICLEIDAEVDGRSSVLEANKCALQLEEEIREHIPAVLFVHVRILPGSAENG